jgi:hypothetical protein
MTSATTLLDESFDVTRVNPDGKKFDKGAWRAPGGGGVCGKRGESR